MSDSNKNDNKVVQFPSHKVKPTKTRGAQLVEKTRQSQRWTVALSLALTVFLASYLSMEMNKSSQVVVSQVVSRGIASEELQERSFVEDKKLADTISKNSIRKPASAGRHPTTRDELTFVFLNSQYLVEDHGGRIVRIQLPEKADAKPVFALPRNDFFAKYQSILHVPEGAPELKDTKSDGPYLFELYEIKGRDEALATVEFQLDRQGYLYKVKVEEVTRAPSKEN